MNDDKRMEIIEGLLWGETPEGELFEMARSQLGFRVYSEEALEYFGRALGLLGDPEQEPKPACYMPQSARIH